MKTQIRNANNLEFHESHGYYMSWATPIHAGDADILYTSGTLTGHVSQYGELWRMDEDEVAEWRDAINLAIVNSGRNIPLIPEVSAPLTRREASHGIS